MNAEANHDYGKSIVSFLLVLVIIFVVPILVYGAISAFTGMQVPGGSAVTFLVGVLISKVGTAIAFVALFSFARHTFESQWFHFAFIWWVMFALGEIGQAIGPNYTRAEAIAGVVSEAIYLPLAAYVVHWILKTN
jgi:hypothetical protein